MRQIAVELGNSQMILVNAKGFWILRHLVQTIISKLIEKAVPKIHVEYLFYTCRHLKLWKNAF